jgi:N-glycosylase/DNA lyase
LFGQDIVPDVPIDLDVTLDCGQTFRWEKSDAGWKGIVRNAALKLSQKDGVITAISSSPALIGMDLRDGLSTYLGLNDDLDVIHSHLIEISKDYDPRCRQIIEAALVEAKGLRILRQDPFETTIAYMISARNSIPAIKRSVEALARYFPENRVVLDGEAFFLFPGLEQMKLLSVKDLERLNLGFRSQWIYRLVQSLEDERFFTNMTKIDLDGKLNTLMGVYGIGFKIASCVSLFAYGELNSFPADVWILRMMKDLFGITGTTKAVTELGMRMFSPYAGYMQEALYRYYRTNKIGRT